MHKPYFNFPALFLGSRWEITFIVFWNCNYKRFLKKAHKIKFIITLIGSKDFLLI
jgi:hypothetical protein